MELGNAIFGNSRGEFEIDRDMMDSIGEWEILLDMLGCDSKGFFNNSQNPLILTSNQSKDGGFKNSVFEIFPYYWGECTCGNEDKDLECTPECLLMKPNFIYFPENVIINWYKYPFRDAYSNKDLDRNDWKRIFQACIDSLRG